jgi:serine/threonine-protein kinase
VAVFSTEGGRDPERGEARPEILGAYELLVELASGGMATVHLARERRARRGSALVAIKRPHRHLAADRGFLTMLVDEARLASSIRHQNVVRVRELGFDAGVPFIAMDYVEGASLAELRRELAAAGRAIDPRAALRVALDMLAGLDAAHNLRDDTGRPLRIVHRDVSPHNVLLGTDGCTRITDFGIAKAEDRVQTTRTHEVKGKLAYLAPERVDHRRICTVQSDVFSAGLVIWECLAGRRVFQSEQMVDLLQEVMTAPIPRLTEVGAPVPRQLDDVIARALSRDLETRYATADAFARGIVDAAGDGGVGTADDVARLVAAVFGGRIAALRQRVRAVIGGPGMAGGRDDSSPQSSESDAPPTGLTRTPADLGPQAASTAQAGEAKVIPAVRRSPRWLGAAGGLAAGVALGVACMWAAAPPSRAASVHVRADESGARLERETVAAPPSGFDRTSGDGAIAVPAATVFGPSEDQSGAPRPAAVPSRPASRGPPRAVGTLRDGFTKLK